MKTYAAYYDNNIRKDSSSGGIFSLLAQQFEVVYGVAMTEDCYGAEFVRIEGDISPLRGSKYLQAKVKDTFTRVKKDLEDGKHVLFSGTGCQINGLYLFLQKEYQNLCLVDVICHGTPSPNLWRRYVAYQESKYGKLKNVNFRYKDEGWDNSRIKENQLYISKDKDPFMRMFLRDYCLRPACYQCKIKHYKKSDITIGDFWGIEEIAPEMSDGMGTSLIITRTEKGQELFNKIKKKLKWKEVCYEDGVRGNSAEYSSVIRPSERGVFFNDLLRLSFEEMKKKYAADIEESLLKRLFIKIKMVIKKIIRKNSKIYKRNTDYGVLFTYDLKD